VRESIEIEASREEVWDVISDLARVPEWVTIHDGFTEDPPHSVEEGTRFGQKLSVGGKSFEVTWTATTVDRPNRLEWSGDGPTGSSARATYQLSPIDSGTRFDYGNEFDLPGGVIGDAAAKAVEPRSQEEAEQSLLKLKRLVES
jgi:uncharacterized protein YndB with AHSA1/START domain